MAYSDAHDAHLPPSERCADACYDLLQSRAFSIGLLDISVEVNGQFVDIELLFGDGVGIGASLDMDSGEVRCCELLDAGSERWLDQLGAAPVHAAARGGDEASARVAAAVLEQVLSARRAIMQQRADR